MARHSGCSVGEEGVTQRARKALAAAAKWHGVEGKAGS
jgi:hypothetical protein